MLGRLFLLPVAAAAFAAMLLAGGSVRAQESPLVVTADVTYDTRMSEGPVHVSWEVSVLNNDPETVRRNEGRILFYDRVALPVLRGAADLSAASSAGTPLTTSVDSSDPGIAVAATVDFDARLFYTETYSFTLSYNLPAVRERSLLVTPNYVFIPAIAAGSDVSVTVLTPPEPPWTVEVEPVDCEGDGATLTCTGDGQGHLAALIELSRPDATATAKFDVPLQGKTLSLSLTYFQGEEAFAQHFQALATEALPVIERVYGFTHPGPAIVDVRQGGGGAVLGYEGLTGCATNECDITISPIADDYTALHELAHLWSDIYQKRWLAEGFAQFIAEETASQLTPGLVQGQPPTTESRAVELQLDDWQNLGSVIGLGTDVEVQLAGYDRSLRFLQQLRVDLGLEVLQKVNAAIAASGQPADSRTFMDLTEDISGRNLDADFKLWVFPESFYPTLEKRREARDRMTALSRSIEGTGLSEDVPNAIREDVLAWRFDDAMAKLDEAEAGLVLYDDLLPRLNELGDRAQTLGLSLGPGIEDALLQWKFEEAGTLLAEAVGAADAYAAAKEKAAAPRNVWERFGLLGSNPDRLLDDSAGLFAAGEYGAAKDKAQDAADLVNDAAGRAFRRLLIVSGFLSLLAIAVGTAFWVSRLRERALAEE